MVQRFDVHILLSKTKLVTSCSLRARHTLFKVTNKKLTHYKKLLYSFVIKFLAVCSLIAALKSVKVLLADVNATLFNNAELREQ